MRGGVLDLTRKAFTTLHVCNGPLINTYCAVQVMKNQLDGFHSHNNPPQIPEDSEQKGDILIQDVCNEGMERNHYMHVVNTDAASYLEI